MSSCADRVPYRGLCNVTAHPKSWPTGGCTYSWDDLQQLWAAAGGNPAKGPMMAAIALAESGGHPGGPPSPTGDIGLWQINQQAHPGATNLTDPLTNARQAVAISGNGTNVAAWCTSWADPKGHCGHGQLSAPQATSCAGQVIASLGGSILPGPMPGPVTGTSPPTAYTGCAPGVKCAWWARFEGGSGPYIGLGLHVPNALIFYPAIGAMALGSVLLGLVSLWMLTGKGAGDQIAAILPIIAAAA